MLFLGAQVLESSNDEQIHSLGDSNCSNSGLMHIRKGFNKENVERNNDTIKHICYFPRILE